MQHVYTSPIMRYIGSVIRGCQLLKKLQTWNIELMDQL